MTAESWVQVDTGGTLKAKDGSIALTANEGNVSNVFNFYGVYLNTNATVETTGAGNILLQGRAGNTPSVTQNIGVFIAGATVQSAGTGTITMIGTGAPGTDTDHGVDVNGGRVTSVSGAITLTGTGGGDASSNSNVGVRIENGGQVTSTGNAPITITGNGGTGTHDNDGVDVTGTGSMVTSVAGAITMTGTGGNDTADSNDGVFVGNGGEVSSTGTGADAATIHLIGVGGTGHLQ